MTNLLRLSACLLLCVSLNSFGASTSTNLQLVSLEQTQFIWANGNEYLCSNYGLSYNTSMDGCIISSVTDYSDQDQIVNFDFQYGDNGSLIQIDDYASWQPSSSQNLQPDSLIINTQGLFSTKLDFSDLPYEFIFIDDYHVALEDWEGELQLTMNINGNDILNFNATERYMNHTDIIDTIFSFDGDSITVIERFSELTWDDWSENTYIFQPSPVPLPAGIYLFLSGLVGLGLMRGRNV